METIDLINSSTVTEHLLAVDLGAESGRVMAGSIEGGRITLEELHRFPNHAVQLASGLHWDILHIYREVLEGLRVAGRERKMKVRAIGIDTWGVDFGLLAADGSLLSNPRQYRDPRNVPMVDRLCETVSRAEIFAASGIQFMTINSLCQWYAAKLAGDPGLSIARQLLFIPDLLNYWLTGRAAAEATIASTSQFYDPRTGGWAAELLGKLGLDASILPPIIAPGTSLGPLLPHVADYTGLQGVEVIASAGHDTASAVAAVPAQGDDWCYISSGTWSLMGVELDAPLINERVQAHNFTNEAGFGGTIRFLKNIAGLWVLQECRREWALEGHTFSYAELTEMAGRAEPYRGYLPPDEFLQPGHMPKQIEDYCRRTNQPTPEGPAAMTRAVLEGLARRYSEVLDILIELTGRPINTIHVVGGGSRNHLLNRLLADRTGRRVIAGPAEATAIGNVLVQAAGVGLIRDLAEGRRMVAASFTDAGTHA